MNVVYRTIVTLMLVVAMVCGGCERLDDDRVYGPCRIDLSLLASWTVYGVTGLGMYRYFIKDRHIPSNYPYTATTYTGMGGVLLMDVGIGAVQPMAFEMACPYERKKSVLVEVDANSLEVVCPQCGSRFDVIAGHGQAVDGPAYREHMGLHRYKVVASNSGGYLITN